MPRPINNQPATVTTDHPTATNGNGATPSSHHAVANPPAKAIIGGTVTPGPRSVAVTVWLTVVVLDLTRRGIGHGQRLQQQRLHVSPTARQPIPGSIVIGIPRDPAWHHQLGDGADNNTKRDPTEPVIMARSSPLPRPGRSEGNSRWPRQTRGRTKLDDSNFGTGGRDEQGESSCYFASDQNNRLEATRLAVMGSGSTSGDRLSGRR